MTPELLFEYIVAVILALGLGTMAVLFFAACLGFFDK